MDKNLLTTSVPVLTTDGCCVTSALPTLAPATAVRLAEALKAMADPTRLRMLSLLAQQTKPLCVCDITAQFDQHQPTISHHLRLLRDAGFVDCEKRGVWAYYWATDVGKHALTLVEELG